MIGDVRAKRCDACIALGSFCVDFALLDINLNGSDSHPVAEALSARGVPLVYSTGNTITVQDTATPAGPC